MGGSPEGGRSRSSRDRPPSAPAGASPPQGARSGSGSRFAKPELDEISSVGDRGVPAGKAAKPLFQKPYLDDMGTSGDHAVPAGAVPRSLFKKQSAAEAHGSDYGVPDDNKSLFRKNSLDEMTVRRTEKPMEGVKPARPHTSPLAGEDSSPREAKPSGSANLVRGDDDPKPLIRARPGAGSYEDPADRKRQTRRPGKTGRPGN